MRLLLCLGLPLIDMDTNCKSASVNVHDLLAIIDDLTKENQDQSLELNERIYESTPLFSDAPETQYKTWAYTR
jgi:hypothetical protein